MLQQINEDYGTKDNLLQQFRQLKSEDVEKVMMKLASAIHNRTKLTENEDEKDEFTLGGRIV